MNPSPDSHPPTGTHPPTLTHTHTSIRCLIRGSFRVVHEFSKVLQSDHEEVKRLLQTPKARAASSCCCFTQSPHELCRGGGKRGRLLFSDLVGGFSSNISIRRFSMTFLKCVFSHVPSIALPAKTNYSLAKNFTSAGRHARVRALDFSWDLDLCAKLGGLGSTRIRHGRGVYVCVGGGGRSTS